MSSKPSKPKVARPADASAADRLSERKGRILRALVHQYVRTGEPVGSEAISQVRPAGVSSATIRNELAALEEMGYLAQPHPSAGRIPTDPGLPPLRRHPSRALRLGEPERREILDFFDEALADVDEILRGTTHLLSRLTRYASVALSEPAARATRRAHGAGGLGSAALLLVVFDTGQVEKRILELPPEIGDEHPERISRGLWERFRGWSIGTHEPPPPNRRAGSPSRDRAILARVAEALDSIEESAASADHVFLGGVANIAVEESFQRRETLREVFEALERETEILELLRGASTEPMPSRSATRTP